MSQQCQSSPVCSPYKRPADNLVETCTLAVLTALLTNISLPLQTGAVTTGLGFLIFVPLAGLVLLLVANRGRRWLCIHDSAAAERCDRCCSGQAKGDGNDDKALLARDEADAEFSVFRDR
jgi:hypothetical protein